MINKIKSSIINLLSFSKIGMFFLCLLIISDLIFIILHCLNIYGLIERNNMFFIENDNSYSEFFQYIKEFWCFIILLFLAIKNKVFPYLVLSLLFLYLLIDDSMGVHENLGKYIAHYFDIESRFNLRGVDFGEFIVSFSVGLIFIFFLSLGYFKSNKALKSKLLQIFLLLLILVFFGVFVDMIHASFNNNHKLGLIEDGGEMITISLITAYLFNILSKSFLKISL